MSKPTGSEKSMGRKKKSPEDARDDVAVKIDRTVADKAMLVAKRKKITLAAYLTDLLSGPVERDFIKAVKDLGVTE